MTKERGKLLYDNSMYKSVRKTYSNRRWSIFVASLLHIVLFQIALIIMFATAHNVNFIFYIMIIIAMILATLLGLVILLSTFIKPFFQIYDKGILVSAPFLTDLFKNKNNYFIPFQKIDGIYLNRRNDFATMVGKNIIKNTHFYSLHKMFISEYDLVVRILEEKVDVIYNDDWFSERDYVIAKYKSVKDRYPKTRMIKKLQFIGVNLMFFGGLGLFFTAVMILAIAIIEDLPWGGKLCFLTLFFVIIGGSIFITKVGWDAKKKFNIRYNQ